MKSLSLLSLLLLYMPPSGTIKERFPVPAGYQSVPAADGSFGKYLTSLPLKPACSHTMTYNGEVAATDDYTAAVVDLSIGSKDLQQCADAVMRLRAEYLWHKKAYRDIHFNFTSGFRCDYVKYAEGYRYSNGAWAKKGKQDYSYNGFLRYMELVFSYAGTLSLEKELQKSPTPSLGSVFIKGGSPGHCFIIVNMATRGNDTLFQLAQSFMPAQNIQMLKDGGNTWFSLKQEPDIPYGFLISRKYLRKFN